MPYSSYSADIASSHISHEQFSPVIYWFSWRHEERCTLNEVNKSSMCDDLCNYLSDFFSWFSYPSIHESIYYSVIFLCIIWRMQLNVGGRRPLIVYQNSAWHDCHQNVFPNQDKSGRYENSLESLKYSSLIINSIFFSLTPIMYILLFITKGMSFILLSNRSRI